MDWYELQRAGLGLEMFDQVQGAIARAADDPLAMAVVEGTTRRVLCHRFPYAVFFEVDGEQLAILAVTHVRRDPIVWRSRTKPSGS